MKFNVDTVSKAYKSDGRKRSDVIPFPKPKNKEQIVMNTIMDLRIVAKALKGDYVPNYSDGSWKYTPVFRMHPGFGFAASHTYFAYTRTVCGSRHDFPNREMSDFFGKKFLKLHKIVLTAK